MDSSAATTEPAPRGLFRLLRGADVKPGAAAEADRRMRRRGRMQAAVFGLLRAAAAVNAAALGVVVLFILIQGAPALSWEFLSRPPTDSMTRGGILPCIVGTFLLSTGAILIAFPVGLASAIYLNEFAHPGPFLRLVRLGIGNLAGVPSVIFGLFGMALFVITLKLGVSLLAGALTLAAMSLPVIIGASEEALRAVPDGMREASLALGATRAQTVFRTVLPAALPGILTGGILAVSRAAGETAPIMFTAAVFYTPGLPASVFDEIMALPYHIYVLATAGTEIARTRPLQYGTALVLIALVLGLNLAAILLRAHLRRKAA
jgi:phosphate transport system permease protein